MQRYMMKSHRVLLSLLKAYFFKIPDFEVKVVFMFLMAYMQPEEV